MPAYRVRTILEIARGLKAFFRLEAGLTRGEVPDPERDVQRFRARATNQQKQLERMKARLAQKDLATKRRALSADRATANGHGPDGDFRAARREVASRYLNGSGLEIGALHQPLSVPSDVTVSYVDRMTVEQLRDHSTRNWLATTS